MEHPSHSHPLILNENYIAGEGDVCHGCREQGIKKKFAWGLINLRAGPAQKFLQFSLITSMYERPHADARCHICAIPMAYKVDQFYYHHPFHFVCVKCAMLQIQQSSEDPKIDHPAHPQHPVALIQQPTSFKCYACNVDDNIRESSYRCTTCQFWMHKSCGDTPTSFLFQFHRKHPLILKFSLPLAYQKFAQFCKLCNVILGRLEWLYCCYNCRFFVHFQCARSSCSLDENENHDPSLIHLPAANTASVNLLLEQFIKGTSTLNNENKITFSQIKHWAHDKHHLQLITINALRDEKDDDIEVLLCDGCIRPIGTSHNSYYGCISCKFFLHKFCAELPKTIRHHLWPGKTFYAIYRAKRSQCGGCRFDCTGIFFYGYMWLHVGCMTLPTTIKHEAHRHPLEQVYKKHYSCKACRRKIMKRGSDGVFLYRCEQCDYYICIQCGIFKPRTLKHRWDPHSLQLIYHPGMVEEHEHEFSCEFCSEEIDTNYWFYHCSHCDLSFHSESCSVLK